MKGTKIRGAYNSLLLNETGKNMYFKWGAIHCANNEDYCYMHDTVFFDDDSVPVTINFNMSGSLVNCYWIDIPIKDTLEFEKFIEWKNWEKKGVWNYYVGEDYIIQYRFQETDNGYLFKLAAEIGYGRFYKTMHIPIVN